MRARSTLALCLLTGIACARGRSPQSPPTWPADLTEGVVAIRIQRWRGDEPVRASHVVLGKDGVWRIDAPRQGEADPESIGNLLFVLRAPAIRSATPAETSGGGERPSFVIELTRPGRTDRVTVERAPLGAPIPVVVQGVGRFLVAPEEMGTKLPDPADLLPPALWTSARDRLDSLEVRQGSRFYRLERQPQGPWKLVSGGKPPPEPDDFAGAITGRQVLEHPEAAPLAALGLEPPAFLVTACIQQDCRAFAFGRVERGGRPHFYARAPDMAPVEIRAEAWELLARGPFVPRAAKG